VSVSAESLAGDCAGRGDTRRHGEGAQKGELGHSEPFGEHRRHRGKAAVGRFVSGDHEVEVATPRAAASNADVCTTSDPVNPSSMMWIPRSAPIASDLRIAYIELASPRVTTVRSLPEFAYLTSRAASTAFSYISSISTSPLRSTRFVEGSMRRSPPVSGISFTSTAIFITLSGFFIEILTLGPDRTALKMLSFNDSLAITCMSE